MRVLQAPANAIGTIGARSQPIAKAISNMPQVAFRTKVFPRGTPSPAHRQASRSLRQLTIRAGASSAPAREVTTSEEVIPGDSSVRLTVTVPSDQCKKMYRRVINHWNNKVAIPGYRKGNAPESVLIDQIGGIQAIYNTVMADLMEEVLESALENTPSSARAISDSERVEQTREELEASFDPNKDFTFTVLFDTLPTVLWKTPYNSLTVAVEAASDAARDAATVEAKLRALLKEGAQLRIVADRGLEIGDVAIIDTSSSVKSTGEAIPFSERKGMQLDTETADEAFLPGVAAAMVGMKPGDEREATITLPDSEDITPKQLRGVEALVKIKVSEVFKHDLPEANDAWAAQLMGPGSTLADIKTRLTENTAAESEDATRQRLADAFTDAVAAAVEVTIPESLIQEAGQNQYTNELNGLMTKGLITYEQAEQLASPQMLASYISKKKDELVGLQKAALGFADILEKEGLAPSEADIERELATALENIAEVQGKKGGDINVDSVKEQVTKGLETQAAMDWLVNNCNVTISAPDAAPAPAAAKKAAPKKTAAAKAEAPAADGEAPKKKRGRPKKNPEA
ncbi:hypothetical protein Ndes2526B_g01807 [Nannochloris sp. 'desiccata']|nr:hypothetical protein KSW81_005715 [Chlorella desiccata (nom. nud.)]KAH7623376.1 putative Trigger factor-like protein TIG, Chloroplastic [Chlorella desiccata (nom. nud.)]